MRNLTYQTREIGKKSLLSDLRTNGMIPAVVYSKGKEPATIAISKVEYAAHLRQIQEGRLSTTVFQLTGPAGNKKVVIKDIQYNVTTYDVIHIDLEELYDDVTVNVKVPVTFIGAMDCQGIKLGGFLRPVIRFVRINCLPKDIPTEFVVDVKGLGIRQSIKLSQISFPKGVKPLTSLNEVVVTIAKR